jgi:regulator of RNase E activity RraA
MNGKRVRPNTIYPLSAPISVITLIDFKQVEENLNSSIISDVLDGMGVRGQAMGTEIRPMDDDMVLIGYAATMLMTDQYDYEKDTFSLQFQAIDSLKEGEVMMVAAKGTKRAALWGELLSTAAKYRGARGVIIDGVARDIKLIREMGFPVFALGINPLSSKGRVIAVDQGCPVEICGVLVKPGDLVVADLDGVVIVPKDIIVEVIEKALDVAARETRTRDELREGSGLYDVYKKYGTI